jgi:hypothetical protein
MFGDEAEIQFHKSNGWADVYSDAGFGSPTLGS